MDTIRSYCGTTSYRPCREIDDIHVEYVERGDKMVHKIEACIAASTTNERAYEICVEVHPRGKRIYRSYCTCPVGGECKHIYKVLCRIASSVDDPIYPSEKYLKRNQKRQQESKQIARGASVYIALACKGEPDSGSDYRYSARVKDNYDQEILGVFFVCELANQCAKEYVEETLGYALHDDDEEEEEGDEDDDDVEDYCEGPFEWDNECNVSGYEYDRVWVELHAIEDASARFRK